ncbi:MAG: phosphate signaling complex protein PhoU [Capsulimonadaceae bacterium]
MTRTHYEEELDKLRHLLLKMGSHVDQMVAQAMEALTQQDIALAESVMRMDDIVDNLDVQIESQCMVLIALQQPMARDLRLIGTALKVITDLERIGDHAVDIAKVARKLARDSFYKPLVDLPRMNTLVRGMLHDALAAFVAHDLSLVDRVVRADDEVDDLFHQLRSELHATMERNSSLVVQASYLLFVAHYLERIADHIVNIAERVYYVETSSLVQLAKSHKAAAEAA